MSDITIITTKYARYETTRCSVQAGKVYFDGHAIIADNVISIVKNGVKV